MLPFPVFSRQCVWHSPFGSFLPGLPALNSLFASIDENVSPLFSWSRALFIQMSRPEFRATCLESIHCPLFEKQRRGTLFRLLSPTFEGRHVALGALCALLLQSSRANSFRMRLYAKCRRKSFRIRRYENCRGWGIPTPVAPFKLYFNSRRTRHFLSCFSPLATPFLPVLW